MGMWEGKKCEEDDSEAWLGTYADAITLLMAFFVLLVNVSKIDIPLYEKVAAGISNQIGKKDSKSPTELLKLDLTDKIFEMQADQAINVGEDDQGVVLEFASSAFYKPGSADIRDEALPVLKEIGDALQEPRYRRYIIELEGHTDDDPISTLQFPSNWELSAGRAARVARFFITLGIDDKRLKVAGFGASRPKVPNRTADGRPIPENQALNRRVLARLYPMSVEDERSMDRTIGADQFATDILHQKRNGQDAQPAPATPATAPQTHR